jgi:hypothetical protein
MTDADTIMRDGVLAALFDATDLFIRTIPRTGPAAEDRAARPNNGCPADTKDPGELVLAEPSTRGGPQGGLHSVEYALASLLSCQVTTYRVWAARLGLEITTLSIELIGEFDAAALLGPNPRLPADLGRARVRICIEGPEEPARYRELQATISAHSPVCDLGRVGASNHAPTPLTVLPRRRSGDADSRADRRPGEAVGCS